MQPMYRVVIDYDERLRSHVLSTLAKIQVRFGKAIAMTQSTPKPIKRRGRIFPEIQWSAEKLAKYQAEKEERFRRCQAIFDRIYPEGFKNHYGWYIAIEPNSSEYFIDADKELASQKARQKYPDAIHCMFCFNETGTCGKI